MYLDFIVKESEKYNLMLLGYCLMTNNIHIIAIPENEDSMTKAIGRTHFKYSQYINKMHNRNGHLWQNRFFSCAFK